MTEQHQVPEGVDIGTPSIARIYDYLLGGSHNYPADHEAAAKVTQDLPILPDILRENRAFVRRCVRYLAEQGVRYFLDLGSGIPAVGNVHEIVQAVDPTARVVYVDNDAVAVAHSREILAGNDGAAVIQGDLREPATILADPQVRRLLHELEEPVAVIMSAVLHFVPDDAQAAKVVAAYHDALPVGSYLAISHGGRVPEPDTAARAQRAAETYSTTVAPIKLRTPDELTALFAGFELMEPGVVYCENWRPEPGRPERSGPPLPQICALGSKTAL
jgi:SAM-dependent methyltransferase